MHFYLELGPADNAKEFSEHLLSLYDMLNAPNSFQTITQKQKQKQIVIPYHIAYINTKSNKELSLTPVFLKFEKCNNGKSYAIVVDDYSGNHLMYFPPEKLDNLKKFCNNLHTSISYYNNSKKEKATDDDFYILLLK